MQRGRAAPHIPDGGCRSHGSAFRGGAAQPRPPSITSTTAKPSPPSGTGTPLPCGGEKPLSASLCDTPLTGPPPCCSPCPYRRGAAVPGPAPPRGCPPLSSPPFSSSVGLLRAASPRGLARCRSPRGFSQPLCRRPGPSSAPPVLSLPSPAGPSPLSSGPLPGCPPPLLPVPTLEGAPSSRISGPRAQGGQVGWSLSGGSEQDKFSLLAVSPG